MFDTHQMEYMLAIAEEGSLTRAADRLFLSQSALSQQLAKLSQQNLPPLFVYQNGRMQPTPAGKLYLNGARAILKIKEDTLLRIRSSPEAMYDPVYISLFPEWTERFCLEVLPAFKKDYPDVLVNLSSAASKTPLDMNMQVHSSNGPVDPNCLHLLRQELVLAGPAGQDCSGLSVLLPDVSSWQYALTTAALNENRIDRPVYAHCPDSSSALALTAQGLCVCVTDRASAEANSGIQVLPWDTPYFYQLSLHFSGKAECSPPHQRLLILLGQMFQKQHFQSSSPQDGQ